MEVVADLDGGGLPETPATYLSLQDRVWSVRVAFGQGGVLDRAIAGTDRASPARPIGGHDLDGDGVAEVFLTTGSGAATVLVGASTLAVAGVRCPAGGGLERLFATSRDGQSFGGAPTCTGSSTPRSCRAR